MKANNIMISPIKMVLYELNDTTADYILCSSKQDVSKYQKSNILGLSFADTLEVKAKRDSRKNMQSKLFPFFQDPMPMRICLFVVTVEILVVLLSLLQFYYILERMICTFGNV